MSAKPMLNNKIYCFYNFEHVFCRTIRTFVLFHGKNITFFKQKNTIKNSQKNQFHQISIKEK